MKETGTRRLGFSFYLLLVFIFFEYGRPQSFISEIGQLYPGWVLHLLLLLWMMLTYKILNFKDIQTKLFIALILLMALHVPLAVNNYWAFLGWKNTILRFIAYLGIINFVDSFTKTEKFINFWIIVNLVCAVIGITHNGLVPGSSFLGDENDFALVMNMALPFAYFMFLETSVMRKKILYLLAMCVYIIANISAMSRGGFVGLIPVVIYCWYKNPKRMLATITIIGLVALFCLAITTNYTNEIKSITSKEEQETGTGAIREYYWKCATRMFIANPLIGVGQENFTWNLNKYEDAGGFLGRYHTGRVCHSLYFTLIAELGLAGILLFGGMLYYSWRDSRQILRNSKKYFSSLAPPPKANQKAIEQLRKLRFIIFGINGGMLGYLAAGTFISVLYYSHFTVLIALYVATNNIGKKLLSELT